MSVVLTWAGGAALFAALFVAIIAYARNSGKKDAVLTETKAELSAAKKAGTIMARSDTRADTIERLHNGTF